ELDRIIQEAIERAYRRAMVNGEMKADAREKYGALGAALADTHLHPIPALEDTVAAVYRVDPRAVDLAEMVRYATDVSRQVAAVDARVKYNYISTLTELSHEIIGHPVELDRALKMETAYAGRSWLLGGLGEHQVGRRVASPLVTAYSDPALPGFGHYKYDHEGTPGRRVVHIDKGIFRGFMNS